MLFSLKLGLCSTSYHGKWACILIVCTSVGSDFVWNAYVRVSKWKNATF